MRIPAIAALLWLASALYASGVAADAPEAWGQPLPAGDLVAIDAALAAFDPAATAQPRKFRGRIVDVCAKRGCWAMLEAEGRAARVTPRDEGFIVPRDVRGEAIVYGTLSSGEDEFRIDALGIEMVE